MNQNEVKLQEGIIYMIECKDSTIREFYVGSTLKTYSYRRDHHKSASKVKKTKLYNFINNNGQWNNWNVNVIEYVYVKTKLDLRLHEQSWIDTLLPTLNSNRAYLSDDELKQYKNQYYQDNIERLKSEMCNFQKVNKDRLKQYRNKVIQCSHCDKTFTFVNKNKHLKTNYCKHYNSTTSESSTESFIESDTESN